MTAQKRESTLLETPIAVSAFSGDTLSAASIRDIRDLQVLVPSYNVTQSQSSFQTDAWNSRGNIFLKLVFCAAKPPSSPIQRFNDASLASNFAHVDDYIAFPGQIFTLW